MWIVRLALRRPYTFVVMCLLIVIFGAMSIVTMAIDIFPYINIPVVGVIWSYHESKIHSHREAERPKDRPGLEVVNIVRALHR